MNTLQLQHTLHFMKSTCAWLAVLLAGALAMLGQDKDTKQASDKLGKSDKLELTAPECGAGWAKYAGNPVLGGNLGTIFDVSLLKAGPGEYRMYCSWRDKKSIALAESRDGLTWSNPVVCLAFDDHSRWEKDLNRPVVLRKDGFYHMWYTGQAGGHSWIGYATSTDGRQWTRRSAEPVLSPELPWEKVAVMCPHVLWDEAEAQFKMWYSGGEQNEPDAIGYATSADGLVWKKHPANPVFACNRQNAWEQHKVTACQVIRREHDYLMFYIGFRTEEYAQIGMARSRDGIHTWERFAQNPIIRPGPGWDASAVYKPYVLQEPDQWRLYYNGRRQGHEQIGIALHQGADLGF